jgi:asparagine synthase (glutamine-hydrolysing)
VCGITGLLDRSRPRADELAAALTSMVRTLVHRGPDDAGTWIDAEAGVALGHRRLSIVDLSAQGHQPMASDLGRFVLDYNGEIYNHGELRRALVAGGKRFRGTSDTEVLVAAIEAWGLRVALERANGMFALALWDRRERSLALARDRLGEKPLYYGWMGAVLVFGSELKALRAYPRFSADIDRQALTLYLRHNCVPAPYSIYSGVRKVGPGAIVTFGPDDGPGSWPEPDAYWSLRAVAEAGVRARHGGPASAADGRAGSANRPVPAPVGDATEGDALDELEGLLRHAVGLRMHADVPLGAFLSGGIDSSLVVALMQAERSARVRTFTIAFDDARYDEASDARKVAEHLGTDHTELLVTGADALDVVGRLPELYDEPFSDSSQIPTTLLSMLTRRHVTVALSGDGGDEVFGGYNRYLWGRNAWRRLSRVPRPARAAAGAALGVVPGRAWDAGFRWAGPVLPGRLRVRMPGLKVQKAASVLACRDLGEVHLRLASHFPRPADVVVDGAEPPSRFADAPAWTGLTDPVDVMMALDTVTYLPDDILTKVDRATMSASLEARVPYLDHRVVEAAWRLPVDAKLQGGKGKWPLRRLLYRHVPEALVERPKMGFGVPLGEWLTGPLRPWAEDLLAEPRLAAEGYLDPATVRGLWSTHLSRRADHAYELWDVLMFQAWLEAQGAG